MKRNRQLTVWLSGEPVAELERLPSGPLRLRFTEQALAVHGLGRPVLSLSLPTTPKRVTGAPVATWFDHLLPEGQVRSSIEQSHAVGPGDTFGLLAAIGADCAGAVQLLAPDQPPRPTDAPATLTPEEFDRLIAALPTWSADIPAQASLGGIQAKALLTLLTNGTWAIPRGGAASTHIIKPEPLPQTGTPPALAAVEHWCLQVAAAARIPAAASELIEVRGPNAPLRKAIVVARYDRGRGEDGHPRRIHQEDFAQAMGIAPARKYETTPEGRLRRMASLLRGAARDPAAELRALLVLVAANVALGNGDAHAKNYSVLIARDGSVSMAPLYDAAPLWYLNGRWESTGFAIDGQTRIPFVTIDHLIAEAAGWGIPAADARRVVTETYESICSAVAELPSPAAHPDLGRRVIRRVVSELSASAAPRPSAAAGPLPGAIADSPEPPAG